VVSVSVTADIETPNWQEAEEWNKDGSLLVTIDNTIDGAGHTASAIPPFCSASINPAKDRS
jgi:hypothetical protein